MTEVQRKKIVESLHNLSVAVKFNLPGFDLKTGLENLAKEFSVSVADLKGMMQKEGIA